MPVPSSDTLQWPATRIGYSGIDNPGFWADWVVADQGIQTAIIAILGVDLTTDFALLGGFAYSGGNYGPGWFYLNGKIYYQPTSFAEGLRLVPNITPANSQVFTDSVSRNTYNINYSQTGTGAIQTPVFSVGGDMLQYRYDNKSLKTPAATWTSGIPTFIGFVLGTGTVTSATFQYYVQGSLCTLSFDILISVTGVVGGVQVAWTLAQAPLANSSFFAAGMSYELATENYKSAEVFVHNASGTDPRIDITLDSSVSSPKSYTIRGQVSYRLY